MATYRDTALAAFTGADAFDLDEFSFDNAGQLTGVDAAGGSASEEAYTYDDNGNRTDSNILTGPHNRLIEDENYTYDYDNEGNLTRKTAKSSGEYVEYTWDHRNRLTATTWFDANDLEIGRDINYRYNADDQLVYRRHDYPAQIFNPVDEEHFVYNGADRVLTYDGLTDQLAHLYVHSPATGQVLFDEVFNELSQQDGFLALAADHLQSTRAVMDETGDIVQTLDYDAFGKINELRDDNGNAITNGIGNTSPDTSQLATSVTHAGRHWDNDAALYQNNACWYDPDTGRFISGANPYRYVGNNPVNFVDPTGLFQAGNPLDALAGGYSGGRDSLAPRNPAFDNFSLTIPSAFSPTDFTSSFSSLDLFAPSSPSLSNNTFQVASEIRGLGYDPFTAIGAPARLPVIGNSFTSLTSSPDPSVFAQTLGSELSLPVANAYDSISTLPAPQIDSVTALLEASYPKNISPNNYPLGLSPAQIENPRQGPTIQATPPLRLSAEQKVLLDQLTRLRPLALEKREYRSLTPSDDREFRKLTYLLGIKGDELTAPSNPHTARFFSEAMTGAQNRDYGNFYSPQEFMSAVNGALKG